MPVIIALIHDMLITAGVYSLVGAEVSSATVAAFLTILGYSMYDTVIVFDRVRENVPRLPRAAFSQIVNRSMSEVLTRSLITGLSTVFLIGVLLIFGGETLQRLRLRDDGRRRLRYILIDLHRLAGADRLEGARVPVSRSPRQTLVDAMGTVPAFPEDNVVAKLGEEEGDGIPGEGTDGAEGAAPDAERLVAEEPLAAEPVGDGNGADRAPQAPAEEPRPEPVATGPSEEEQRAKAERRAQKKARQAKRRKKHGRHR